MAGEIAGDLGATVRATRLAAGLSQAQLAKRTGISASYLSRIETAAWERGGPWPADAVLCSLARALGLSSTELIGWRNRARATVARGPRQPVGLARANGRPPYAVSVGPEHVDAAARRVVAGNPPRGTFRSVQVPAPAASDRDREGGSTYVDALAERVAVAPETLLYRVTAPARRHLDPVPSPTPVPSGRNVRARVAYTNPVVLDVLIGEHQALIALPDRRGHPHLAACLVVDDPDFVAAMREWYDEWVWEPPGASLAPHVPPGQARDDEPAARMLS